MKKRKCFYDKETKDAVNIFTADTESCNCDEKGRAKGKVAKDMVKKWDLIHHKHEFIDVGQTYAEGTTLIFLKWCGMCGCLEFKKMNCDEKVKRVFPSGELFDKWGKQITKDMRNEKRNKQ